MNPNSEPPPIHQSTSHTEKDIQIRQLEEQLNTLRNQNAEQQKNLTTAQSVKGNEQTEIQEIEQTLNCVVLAINEFTKRFDASSNTTPIPMGRW